MGVARARARQVASGGKLGGQWWDGRGWKGQQSHRWPQAILRLSSYWGSVGFPGSVKETPALSGAADSYTNPRLQREVWDQAGD